MSLLERYIALTNKAFAPSLNRTSTVEEEIEELKSSIRNAPKKLLWLLSWAIVTSLIGSAIIIALAIISSLA